MTALPADLLAEVERLTLLARRAEHEVEADGYRRERDERLAAVGYEARVREEDRRAVLVCYPSEWLEDGTVRLDRIEDRSRAVEVPLDGVGEEAQWADVEAHNRAVVAEVEAAAGPVHAANASAFADFMGNHYVGRVEDAGDREVREFLAHYYPRNAWPSDEQRAVVRESLRRVFAVTERDPPVPLR